MGKLAIRFLLPLVIFVLLSASSFPPAADSQTARVKRICDGDTPVLTDGERFRLIGVDPPEKFMNQGNSIEMPKDQEEI